MSSPTPSSSSNQQWRLAKRPQGLPDDSTFKLEDSEIPQCGEGEVLVKTLYFSVDPYMRGLLTMYPEGNVMTGAVAGEIIESKEAEFKVGAKIQFYGQWARYQTVNPSTLENMLIPGANIIRVDESLAPISDYLNVLGMPGVTAYFGLKDVASFKKDDIVLVSGAAGAVGSVVGQLAKKWGAKKVIGVAGGAEKCQLVTEKFGFDACVDYKEFNTRDKMTAELKRLSPDGYDIYFDNTGGHTTDAFFNLTRKYARMALCGQISNYNSLEEEMIPNPFAKSIYNEVTIKGFLVSTYGGRYAEFISEVGSLVKSGELKYEETVVEGFDKIPEAFIGLFHGKNKGKMVVKA